METSNVCETLIDNNHCSNIFEKFAVRAIISDYIEICELFKFATEYYKNKGIKQWDKGYDLVKIYQSIILHEMFVIRNDRGILLCTFAISNQLPNYYPKHLQVDSNTWVVKSLCTNLKHKSFIGRKIVGNIIKTADNNCIQKIYLDYVMDNPILEVFYKRYGFRRITIAEHPRYAQNMVIMAREK
ncbi:MAG: hypothetical protein AAF757_30190 [Cyanobacteria bacterium P01_D01_bin.116]